ncbi:LiaI-LiaF-like domain-containing protein [Calditrichota bacterium]
MNEENKTSAEQAEPEGDLQKRFDELAARLEKLETAQSEPPSRFHHEHVAERHYHYRGKNSSFWGVVLICFGGFWIMRELGWLDFNIPFWPSVLVVIGLYILFTSGKLDHDED